MVSDLIQGWGRAGSMCLSGQTEFHQGMKTIIGQMRGSVSRIHKEVINKESKCSS